MRVWQAHTRPLDVSGPSSEDFFSFPSGEELSALLDLVISGTRDETPAPTAMTMISSNDSAKHPHPDAIRQSTIPILPQTFPPVGVPSRLDFGMDNVPPLVFSTGPTGSRTVLPPLSVPMHTAEMMDSNESTSFILPPHEAFTLETPQRTHLQLMSPLALLASTPMENHEAKQPIHHEKSKNSKCSFPGCSRGKQGNGRCIRHGGGKRCSVDGCTRGAQAMGRCKSHGGGSRCKVEGCNRGSQGSGLCRTHGGGKLCVHPGCKKGIQRNRRCSTHGGCRKCSVEGCPRVDRGGGRCGQHQ